MTSKHRKSNKKKIDKTRLEQVVSFRFLTILGVLFLLLGVYFSTTTTKSLFTECLKILQGFLSPTVEEVQEIPGTVSVSSLALLFRYFLPAVFISGISSWFAKKHPFATYIISSLTALYFIILQVGIFTGLINPDCIYVNSLSASGFLLISVLPLTIAGYIHRKSGLINLTIFYFYFTVVLYAASIALVYWELALCIAIFSYTIAWLSSKIKRLELNLLNFLFAIGIICLFFIRKLLVNSRLEFLTEFLIVGVMLYFVFYSIVIYTSNLKENGLKKWMQLLISWSNLLIFLSSTTYILLKYYSIENLNLIVLGLLAFNMGGLYFVKKFALNAWKEIYFYINIFLISLFLSLTIHLDILFVFVIICSAQLLMYGFHFKSKTAYWSSLGFMLLSFGLYFDLWISSFLPAMFSNQLQPVLLEGLFTNLLMIGFLIFTSWQLGTNQLLKLRKWYSSANYLELIYLLLHIAFFLGAGWSLFALVSKLTGCNRYTSITWFISGCIYFIATIHYYAGKKSTFKKPILYIAYIFALLSPLFLGWSVTSEYVFYSGNFYLIALVLHYFAIILLVILGIMTIKRIFQRNRKKIIILQGVQILTILILAILYCIEYDNLFILSKFIQYKGIPMIANVTNLMIYNQFLPYSISIWVLSVSIFIYAYFKKMSFLRKCSLVLFFAVIVKILVFDLTVLNSFEQSMAFYILGVFLIVIALLYQRLVKSSK
jgi:hypothetical protein